IRLCKRRFLVLAVFCFYSMSNSFQWIEYAIISDIILKYYKGTSTLAVVWTSMVYMLAYIPCMFVATWILDKWGMRKTLLLGAILNAVGATIKIGSVSPNLFAVSFVGQTISAISQGFLLEMPPKIASVYFGPNEVSTATSIGVFGNQLGVALGFLLPPLIVPNGNLDEIGAGLRILFISSASACCLAALLIFAFMKDGPPLPPSRARWLVINTKLSSTSDTFSNYKRSLRVLIRNMPFLITFFCYGIITGVYYALGSLLNMIIGEMHEAAGQEIGQIGLTMVVTGLGGSVLCGIFLDKTKLYKPTTLGVYVFSLAFMIIFACTLHLALLWLDYITIGLLGFFMAGYLPIGFELAAEITYPESEATSAGLLNVSANAIGIVLTLCAEEIHRLHGSTPTVIFMSATLFLGTVLTALVKTDLKRQKAGK
uniref:Major facilitator superfamily (MFS) profile domain-containing protein n=2 Tax=Ciona intestinalis TaxID=7719 RepID=F6YSI6_CIOIN